MRGPHIKVGELDNDCEIKQDGTTWPVAVPGQQVQQQRADVAKVVVLATGHDALAELGTIGKTISHLIETLISKGNSQLAIGPHSDLILPKALGWGFALTLLNAWLAGCIFIP